ncbi:DUF418 domain-containing protein [Corynebacterium hansenii]|uniref:DUF418 domain-containing protein n=1 Tax=Corynebacterium hansenii TaxID=394964 RepID=A0ABV7ZRE5_9CORY|nr:DUF418 domain-containing protein [Corynebacterium hansenii]WJY99857.1 hypothetical protein CHAN_06190 [Corynebacterium hansenii]
MGQRNPQELHDAPGNPPPPFPPPPGHAAPQWPVAKPKPTFRRTAVKERILAPDVARGFMLLGIAVANAVTAWMVFGSAPLGQRRSLPTDGIVTVANDVLFHVRGLPMFAMLFGYGIGMLVMREYGRGVPWAYARGLLLKRYGWLAAFGVLHGIFLFFGDILLTYALMGLMVTFLVPLRNKTLLWIAAVLGVLSIGVAFLMQGPMSGMGAANAQPGDFGGIPFGGDGYLGRQLILGVFTVVSVPVVLVLAGPQLIALMLVGVVAARMRILEDSETHGKLLAIVAAIGATAAVSTGVLSGLSKLGIIGGTWAQAVSQSAGILAGPGLIAVIALLCRPVQRRIREAAAQGTTLAPPAPLAMMQALGQRSMSGYVAQSVLFLPLAGGWLLDRFSGESVTVVSLWGAAVWLVTLIGAWLLAKAGKAGPLEAMHRRLTYGPRG